MFFLTVSGKIPTYYSLKLVSLVTIKSSAFQGVNTWGGAMVDVLLLRSVFVKTKGDQVWNKLELLKAMNQTRR